MSNINGVLDHAQTIVIGNSDPGFKWVPQQLRDGQVVVDLVRIDDRRTQEGVYHGICWKLGRGER